MPPSMRKILYRCDERFSDRGGPRKFVVAAFSRQSRPAPAERRFRRSAAVIFCRNRHDCSDASPALRQIMFDDAIDYSD
jgi:hypothetical protein